MGPADNDEGRDDFDEGHDDDIIDDLIEENKHDHSAAAAASAGESGESVVAGTHPVGEKWSKQPSNENCTPFAQYCKHWIFIESAHWADSI